MIFLKLSIWDVPCVRDEELLTVTELAGNIFVVRAVHGFKETPDINHVMALLEQKTGTTLLCRVTCQAWRSGVSVCFRG